MKRFLFLFFCSFFLYSAVAQAQTQPPTVDQTWQAASDQPIESDSESDLQELIVCAGDSITVGYPYCLGATADSCTVDSTFVPRLSALSGVPTVNKGYGGAESWYGRAKIDEYLSQYKPQILTIYYGNNDAGDPDTGTEYVISDLRYMVDRCLAYGTRPVIATLGPQFGAWAWRQPYILDINYGIRQLASEKGIAVADIGAALWGQQSYFYDDIHPNTEGHEIIANLFYRAINQCAYGLSPLSEYVKHSGGTGSVSVTTGTGSVCSWTAVSNVDWIEVTGGSSGVGSGTVTYQVAFNNTGRERTGTLTIAGKTFTVSQKKAPVLNFLPLLLEE